MEIKRTKKEIEKKISEICSDSDNFTYDNYGSEAADNGIYEVGYSDFKSERTLKDFFNWLINNNK